MYIVSNRTKPRKGLWKKTKRKLADLIRSASFTEVGVALDYSANWQTRVVGSYIMIYEIDASTGVVRILRFFHSLENYADKL